MAPPALKRSATGLADSDSFKPNRFAILINSGVREHMKHQDVFWKTIGRLVKQSAIPLLISAAYATWVYFNKGSNAHPTDAISAFGASFFFCMWLLGQFFRTSKQLSDSESFDRLSAGIGEINKSIRELRAMPSPNASPIGRVSIPSPPNQLMLQARELAKNGHVLAALLQAGVAFEQAALSKAARMGLYRHNFHSFPRLLQKIEEQLGPGAKTELQSLWKFRNQIVHADPQASEELQQRPELVDFFDSGIRMLDSDRVPSNNSGD